MNLNFYKYQGTGNDFVVIDNRTEFFPKDNYKYIQNICDRKFGVGADGLILLEHSNIYNFKMVYYNADGKEGSMCGNGGRCLVAFANQIGIIGTQTEFEAIDGVHYAGIEDDIVKLKMKDVFQVEQRSNNSYFLDTGSPHHIEFVKDLNTVDVMKRGREIRYASPYFDEGTNVNFVQKVGANIIKIRTYERGVEDETFSCGTGATAAIIASSMHYNDENIKKVQVMGGTLQVDYNKCQNSFDNIYLKGEALFVFKGQI